MATNSFDILDVNIVAVPSEPLLRIPNLATLFESSEFAPLLRQPLALSQGVTIEPGSGAALQNYAVESIRSQKTVTFAPTRIEVHDRSGSEDLANVNLPKLLLTVVTKVGIDIRAIGVNFEASIQSKEGSTASSVIGTQVITPVSDILPSRMRIVGAGVRYFFVDDADNEAEYTVAVEPRGIDRSIDVIWMSCNAQVLVSELPSEERLEALLERCRDVVLHIRGTLSGDGA